MRNPYTLVFGKEPIERISRLSQQMEIMEAFREEPPLQQIYMITGLRGAGKTVFMTEIAEGLAEDKDWVVVELNGAGDLLGDLAAALASETPLAQMFQKAEINLSFFGLGLEVKGSVPITNLQVALTRMLESLKAHKKRLLVCIDEVTVTEQMKVFSGAFQIFVRQNLPVCLLMTGLYENINNLQNEPNLTFLYRAPKLELRPLNLITIGENYKKVLGVDEKAAYDMAKFTKGYSFAFQVLGYFTFRCKGDYLAAMPEVRQYLEDYVYEKVWSEMSKGDRRLAYGVAKSASGKAGEIKEILGIANNEYTPYRSRLMKRGILTEEGHGYVQFTLPLFKDYVIINYEMVLG